MEQEVFTLKSNLLVCGKNLVVMERSRNVVFFAAWNHQCLTLGGDAVKVQGVYMGKWKKAYLENTNLDAVKGQLWQQMNVNAAMGIICAPQQQGCWSSAGVLFA